VAWDATCVLQVCKGDKKMGHNQTEDVAKQLESVAKMWEARGASPLPDDQSMDRGMPAPSGCDACRPHRLVLTPCRVFRMNETGGSALFIEKKKEVNASRQGQGRKQPSGVVFPYQLGRNSSLFI
jgi:hypothetical protein